MPAKRATIKDIAGRAGVSETTVSLSFNEKSRISAKTRKRILSIARELNYFPNLLARNLRSGKTKNIGFIVLDITNPFYSRMVKYSVEIARERGYQVIFAESNYDPYKEIDSVENMIHSRVQGFLVCFCEKTKQSLELIKRSSQFCIAIDTCPVFYDGAYVINDLFSAGYLASKHLTERGCKSIAFLRTDPNIQSISGFILMENGFTQYLKEQGSSINKPVVVDAGMTVEEGMNGFRHLMDEFPEVDGVFCVNDLCAFGAIQAADEDGIEVGKDIAVMGIDNLNISSLARISLTSIDQPYTDLVEIATNALIDSIEDNEHPVIRKAIQPVLCVRDSTKIGKLKVNS